MKKLTLALVLGLFLLSTPIFIFAQCGSRYEPNKTLSDYLVAQGFRVGISRDEALKHYPIDQQRIWSATSNKKVEGEKAPSEDHCLSNSKLINQSPYNSDPIGEGFYEIYIKKGQVEILRKCVSTLSEPLGFPEVITAFKNKYRIKEHPPWFICHSGRSIAVDLRVFGRCVVVDVTDFSRKVEEDRGIQNKRNRELNRLKNKL